jgi:hypothetical protein
MITRLLFKNLPFELNELILLYTGEYGLNVIFGYEKNIKKIIQKNNYNNLTLYSAIKYNLKYKFNQYDIGYITEFLITSIKYNSKYWIDFLLEYQKTFYYKNIDIEIFYFITSKGNFNLFERCYLQGKPDLNKNVQHKLLNIVSKKGYVKMLDYFIQNLKFEIISKKKIYLERAIYYKRKNIVKYLNQLF